jgi:16S rRNA (uracil1498-N3)-methyltransferase
MSQVHHNRFYVAPADFSEDRFHLSSEELRHLKVKRLQVGDALFALDGKGKEYKAEVESIDRKEAICRIVETKFHPEPQVKIILGLGIIRPGPISFACEKATELGVWEIIPLQTDYTQRNLSDNEIVRLNRITLSTMKQAGGFFHISVSTPKTLKQLLMEYRKRCLVLYAHQSGEPFPELGSFRQVILILIGPEGGFSSEEIEFMRRENAKAIVLSESRLRSETAAIVAIALAKQKIVPQKFD